MKEKEKGGLIIQSVDRAMDILMLLGDKLTPMSAVEISAQTGINRTTIYALLHTLESKRFIEKRPSNQYCIGPIVFQLGLAYQKNSTLVRSMEHHAPKLTEKWNYSAKLGIYNGAGKMLLLVIQTPHELTVSAPIYTGMTYPMHATALGKVLLAYLDFDLDQFVQQHPLTRYTASTVTDIEALRAGVQEIRTNGYCYETNEFMDNLSCVASPIFDENGNVVAAISLSVGTDYMKQVFNELVRDAMALSRLISYDMGWKP